MIGDTFVVGCKFSDKNIYPDTFNANPDAQDPLYSSEYGIYQPGCGLDNVMLSWGHDEVRTQIFITDLAFWLIVSLFFLSLAVSLLGTQRSVLSA